ncbi:MaoC/PaaZ C-terminal domain-containing protein [Rhodococcus opacus]|uniref:MaoC/PaaZ C-terminal domain-containing protein n=1 Tax=Rhodococcus TaxID=1827 RepID=UPI0006BB48C3|nr:MULTISPECIES: MaoC/PaaZ C-terminal domain-containing protein [Rhodococcus]MDI9934646.1 MaoC/PaaZ C-terminal domain-containing protein [Rhodococcus sp. IEGM 1351]QZS57429.1 acyl dehydratase [Rhodococcus opacus]RKM75953.1 acyl dehydratase [Rhodococcus opacus]UNN00763.1 acyl dehydratase [Rhodococcus opacus]WKN53728.1 MaoC/PaaZ C-terminal domain-containing protein [Rhodococcus opacus]
MTSPQRIMLGDTVAKARYHVTRESLVRYAGASGDFNSIHYRDDVANAVGLPGVLAHGMLTLGLATQCVVDWLGDAARVTGYRARFTKPVIVAPDDGAVVEVVAKAAQVDEAAGTARIDLTVTFDGHTVLGKSQVWISLR